MEYNDIYDRNRRLTGRRHRRGTRWRQGGVWPCGLCLGL